MQNNFKYVFYKGIMKPTYPIKLGKQINPLVKTYPIKK